MRAVSIPCARIYKIDTRSLESYDYFFTTPTTGFVADWKHQILRTTDGGKKWQPAQAKGLIAAPALAGR
jgi:photosystem II stability/assembly factor-like uncharacterized protein